MRYVSLTTKTHSLYMINVYQHLCKRNKTNTVQNAGYFTNWKFGLTLTMTACYDHSSTFYSIVCTNPNTLKYSDVKIAYRLTYLIFLVHTRVGLHTLIWK